MTTEDVLRAALVGDNTITGIVANRIYPNVLPDTVTFPAIAFHTVSAVRIGGVCVQRRIQVDCYASSYSSVKALRNAVQALADTQKNWQYIEGPDLYEEDTKLHHQVVDIVIS